MVVLFLPGVSDDEGLRLARRFIQPAKGRLRVVWRSLVLVSISSIVGRQRNRASRAKKSNAGQEAVVL